MEEALRDLIHAAVLSAGERDKTSFLHDGPPKTRTSFFGKR
jgi:hypothetical protein